jgi:putative ABC transport system permease protein
VGVTPMDGLTRVPPLSAGAGLSSARTRGFRGTWVMFTETLKLSLDALRAHKLRSFLTLLGVILAVMTLVVVMSFIAGLNLYVATRIANLGANVFIIDRFGIITSEEDFVKAQKRPLITLEDYQRIRDTMKLATAVAGEEDQNAQVRYKDIVMENTSIMGVTSNFADVRNINVEQGRFFTPSDDEHRSEAVFIGADLAKKFFPNVDPIGKTIRAKGRSYQVIGVAEAIGTAFGQSQDNYLMLPLGTYRKGWHRPTDWVAIFVQAPGAEMMSASEDEARMLFRAWRHVPNDAPDNFAILGSDSIMALWHELTGNLAFVAVALVSVFLVVGGIVIMNIMLASVTERTREIGLRRSLGARKRHILMQFMTESAVLAAVGGMVGIVLAYAVVFVGRATLSLPLETPIGAVILALCLSTGVGLFFGIFPAMRAAKLDPIEALRADG